MYPLDPSLEWGHQSVDFQYSNYDQPIRHSAILVDTLRLMQFPQTSIQLFISSNKDEIDSQPDLSRLDLFMSRFIDSLSVPLCPICLQPLTSKLTLHCSHTFCLHCLTLYLTTQIRNHKVQSITCMMQSCGESLTQAQIKSCVNGEQYGLYEKYKMNQMLSRNPDLRWCTAVGCERYIMKKQGERKMVCGCGQEVCYECGQGWHQRTCEAEFKAQYGKIVESLHLQKCPKCGLHVEKLSGCNHMRCTKCRYEFCWLCLGRYSNNHYKWWNMLGCPKQQHSDNYWCGWKYVFILTFIPLLAIVLTAGLAMSVLFAVIYGLVMPAFFIKRLVSGRIANKTKRIVVWVVLQILAIVLYPIIMVFMLVPGSCIIGYKILAKRLM